MVELVLQTPALKSASLQKTLHSAKVLTDWEMQETFRKTFAFQKKSTYSSGLGLLL